MIVTDDPTSTASRLRKFVPELSVEDILATPYLWIGTVDSICDQVRAARERSGFTYFTVFHHSLEAAIPVTRRLHTDVEPNTSATSVRFADCRERPGWRCYSRIIGCTGPGRGPRCLVP